MTNEKRLIDANVLMRKLSRMIDYCETDSKVSGLTALFQMGDAIMDCPTVDAVEVVRCKDCICAFMTYDREKVKYCDMFPSDDGVFFDKDFYCGYGERKPQKEERV